MQASTIHQTEASPLTADGFNDFMKDALRELLVEERGTPPQHVQTHLSSQQQAALILLERLVRIQFDNNDDTDNDNDTNDVLLLMQYTRHSVIKWIKSFNRTT